jgi:hypothetical protein
LTPSVPGGNVNVALIKTAVGGRSSTTATTRTNAQRSYRFDNVWDLCPRSAALAAGCLVEVVAASGQIQDIRQVVLGNDPSTTTQNLDWRHIPDRHALSGMISGTVWPDSEVKVASTDRPEMCCRARSRRCAASQMEGVLRARWRLENIQALSGDFPAQSPVVA